MRVGHHELRRADREYKPALDKVKQFLINTINARRSTVQEARI